MTWLGSVWDYLKASIARNAGVLTALTVAGILFTGFTVLTNPEVYYVPLLVFAVAALGIILSGAKTLIKVILAIVLTCIYASLSLNIGTMISPTDASALVWFMSYFISLCLTLFTSYQYVTANSRWGSMIGAQTVGFIASYVAALAFLSNWVAAVVVLVFVVLTFVLLYHLTRQARVNRSKMPTNVFTEEMFDVLQKDAKAHGYEVRGVLSDDDTGYAHVFNTHLFNLYPVYMDSPLRGILNRRKRYAGMGYKGTNVNPWLVNNTFALNPTWTSKGATGMLVLLDFENANGESPKVLECTLPDTHATVMVGIVPARSLVDDKSPSRIFDALEGYKRYIAELSEKQKQALRSIGRTPDTAVEKED